MHGWLAHVHVHLRLHDIKQSRSQQVLPRHHHHQPHSQQQQQPRNIIRLTRSIDNWRPQLAPAPARLTTTIAIRHWKHKQRDAVMAATVNAIWKGSNDVITRCIWKHSKWNCCWKIYLSEKTTTTIRRWVHEFQFGVCDVFVCVLNWLVFWCQSQFSYKCRWFYQRGKESTLKNVSKYVKQTWAFAYSILDFVTNLLNRQASWRSKVDFFYLFFYLNLSKMIL